MHFSPDFLFDIFIPIHRHALSALSDAEFDICTSSDLINYGIEDEDDEPEGGEEP